eukprot:jgi/Mesen1/5055/ME000252S04174
MVPEPQTVSQVRCTVIELVCVCPHGQLCRERQRLESNRLQNMNSKLAALNKLLVEENELSGKKISALTLENAVLREELAKMQQRHLAAAAAGKMDLDCSQKLADHHLADSAATRGAEQALRVPTAWQRLGTLAIAWAAAAVMAMAALESNASPESAVTTAGGSGLRPAGDSDQSTSQ